MVKKLQKDNKPSCRNNIVTEEDVTGKCWHFGVKIACLSEAPIENCFTGEPGEGARTSRSFAMTSSSDMPCIYIV